MSMIAYFFPSTIIPTSRISTSGCVPQQRLYAAIQFAHARPGFHISGWAGILILLQTVLFTLIKKREEPEEQAVARRRSREQELMLETSAGGRRGPLVAIMLAVATVLGTS